MNAPCVAAFGLVGDVTGCSHQAVGVLTGVLDVGIFVFVSVPTGVTVFSVSSADLPRTAVLTISAIMHAKTIANRLTIRIRILCSSLKNSLGFRRRSASVFMFFAFIVCLESRGSPSVRTDTLFDFSWLPRLQKTVGIHSRGNDTLLKILHTFPAHR